MSADSTVWLLSAADQAYAQPLAVTLASALRHLAPGPVVKVLVLENDFTPDTRRRLERIAARRPGTELRFHHVRPDELEGLPQRRWISPIGYARLFMGEYLPPECRRVLYLDADLLVLADLMPLWQRELTGRTMAAVPDYLIESFSHRYTAARELVEAGTVPADQAYFNSGVMLIDLDRWRSLDLGARTRVHAHAQRGDQDSLNIEMVDDWAPLAAEWNVQGSLLLLHEHDATEGSRALVRRRRALLSDARIVHFSGSIKSWHASSTNPWTRRWRRVLRESGWFDSLADQVRTTAAPGTRFALYRTLVALRLRTARERTADEPAVS